MHRPPSRTRRSQHSEKTRTPNAYGYIRTKQERGTIVWSHRDDENWIDNATVDVVVMGVRRKQLRLRRSSLRLGAPDAGV